MLEVTFRGSAGDVLAEMKTLLGGPLMAVDTALPADSAPSNPSSEVFQQALESQTQAEPAEPKADAPRFVVTDLSGGERPFDRETNAVKSLVRMAEATTNHAQLTALGEANESLREVLSEKNLALVTETFTAKRKAFAPEPEPVAEPTPEPEAAKPLTVDDMRLKLRDLCAINMKTGTDLLSEFGAQKVSELKPEQYAAFVKKADGILAVQS